MVQRRSGLLARKPTAFLRPFSCSIVGNQARASRGNSNRLTDWSTVATLPTGRVYLSVMPLDSQGQQLGFITLLHDLSFIERREAQARTFLLIAFGILAVMACGATDLRRQARPLRLDCGTPPAAAGARNPETRISAHPQRPPRAGERDGGRTGRLKAESGLRSV